jgi:predicted alpha/beta superfamily hydrolase
VRPSLCLSQSTALEPTREASPSGQVTLRSSQEYRLQSRINGREYLIQVALPIPYDDSGKAATARYPVMYLLDGNLELPLVAAMFRLSNAGARGDGVITDRDPEQVIFVGVGYPPGDGIAAPRGPDGVPYRRRDYSPPPYPASNPAHKDWQSEQPWAGGAPLFLRVLKEEIIPAIDRRYRTTADRGLHGHSLGALFVGYVLFTEPDLFSRYAMTSPSLWWDGGSMFSREEAFAKTRTSLPKHVFLSVGSLEGAGMIADMWRLVSQLCRNLATRRYAGLKITAEVLLDEYHGSAVPFSRALKALYPPVRSDTGSTRNPCSGA